MDKRDKKLGMDRAITRRDFLGGVGIAVSATLLPGCGDAPTGVTTAETSYYPPLQTGLRGSHPGSFEVAHATMQGQTWSAEDIGEYYDLVVVGAGISGLSAAHIYRRDVNADASILIIDNHDDFGGHAKRNEFELDGRTLLSFGGTMFIEAPRTYPDVAQQVTRDLGLDINAYAQYHHAELFDDLNLKRAHFLDGEVFGTDHLSIGTNEFSDLAETSALSDVAKQQLKQLFADDTDYLVDIAPDDRRQILETMSWRAYLEQYAGLGEEALAFVQKWPHGVWSIGADALPAWMASLTGYPGFAGVDLQSEEGEPFDGGLNFHYPDGNASIARLLVRHLVPNAAPGDTMEDVVMAQFDYSQLDLANQPTRIRLNSTVVDLRHQDGDLSGDVDVTYVVNGKGRRVSASQVIWAGYHAMLPKVCPDVPAKQAVAQKHAVRSPLVYTSVLISNWTSLAKLGFWDCYCPGSFFQRVRIARPTSIGDYAYPTSPEEPMVLHLQHIPLAPGQPAADQFRAGRRQLLETSFEDFERNLRDQLGRMLAPGGFDPATDIKAITVNRWPHGYAYSTDPESGEVAWWPELWPKARRPWEDARAPVGNIAIAGTDASSNAMTESAIEQAHRAVGDIA